MIGIRAKGKNNKKKGFYEEESFCRVCQEPRPKGIVCSECNRKMRNKPNNSKLRQKYLNSAIYMGS